jgi:hypothetical protein
LIVFCRFQIVEPCRHREAKYCGFSFLPISDVLDTAWCYLQIYSESASPIGCKSQFDILMFACADLEENADVALLIDCKSFQLWR